MQTSEKPLYRRGKMMAANRNYCQSVSTINNFLLRLKKPNLQEGSYYNMASRFVNVMPMAQTS
jgi:hypothetical protein